MKARKRLIFVVLASAGLAVGGAACAAAGPAALTDAQLDGVTAGAVGVTVNADATGVGVFTLTGTNTNAFAVGGASSSQPGEVTGAGLADGAVVAVGTNFGGVSSQPAGSSTSLQTGGSADGDITFGSTVNTTIHSAGGVTVQLGWTYVAGSSLNL